MSADPTFWLLARASGLLAYWLITATVLAGLVLRSRPFGAALKPAAVTDLHRFLSLTSLAAVGVHGIALVADRAVEIAPAALLVPGISPYRPVWTGLGVIGAELMAILVLSFSIRKWIGTRTWRRLHLASYGIFVLATAHGLAAGTDSGLSWVLGLYLVAVGLVAAATTWRILASPPRGTRGGRASRGIVSGSIPASRSS